MEETLKDIFTEDEWTTFVMADPQYYNNIKDYPLKFEMDPELVGRDSE